MRKILLRNLTLVGLAALVFACVSIAPFSLRAYEQATSLKVDALLLMDRATEPFAAHAKDVAALKRDLEKAYEYAKGRPKNEESTRQWAILIDAERNLLGGFLKRWQDKSTLSPVLIEEAKALVADGFDAVIELESGKRKPAN